MSDQTILKAELREQFGKGAARRLRRDGKVPAVLYGHGMDPIHVALPGHETLLALRVANAVLRIEIVAAEEQLALAKQVQRDPIRGSVEHVDFVVVRVGEKVTVEVAITLTGDAEPGAVVVLDAPTISLEVVATDIPEQIEVSIEGLPMGTQILVKDLQLPEGATVAGDPETLVVNITAPAAEEATDEAPAAEATDAASAGSEG